MTQKLVIWSDPDGFVKVLTPAPGVDEHVWRKDIPADVDFFEVTEDKMPKDRLFRSAWKIGDGGCFECPIKAKQVAHEIRRNIRAEKFKPYDEIVSKAIPGEVDVAEKQRQYIRDADALIQEKLDVCKSVDELRVVLDQAWF